MTSPLIGGRPSLSNALVPSAHEMYVLHAVCAGARVHEHGKGEGVEVGSLRLYRCT